jgi:predicted small integral membrane protein
MLSLPPQWMYWTLPTLFFLGSIILLLTTLTIWDVKDPGYAREGLLPIETTRGDRVFMSLLITGCTFCLWLITFSSSTAWAVLLVGAVAAVGVIKFF